MVGVSRGGKTTKIHAIVDALGNPLTFSLSKGNDHDSVHAIELMEQIDITGSNVIGDKAYGSKAIRAYIKEKDADYTIPPKVNDPDPWFCDWWTYKERHLIECFFSKLKWFRRIAMRFDKLDSSFLAFVFLASIAVLVK